MPFGAHETMEVHEILNEKLNMIQHFQLYAQMTQQAEIRAMLQRQLAAIIPAYNQLVAYTHDYAAANRQLPSYPSAVSSVSPQQIQYGLSNPMQMGVPTGSGLTDSQIVSAMLSCHKNSAKLHMQASLECADPNVRQMLIQGAVRCAEQAYEVFLFMNRQGMYQVPTMNDHTAKTFLHSYQPVQLQDSFAAGGSTMLQQ
ncbi:spore coat protein [Paenibacillus sp. YYML68]|uniref:spore coat protein n=1 Tax=Paenibacillus sp. YYML68 TaxID=2909250 RepID=UPI0024924C5E|nr:spore coat protein [Paenibacillus sp. YYML68]